MPYQTGFLVLLFVHWDLILCPKSVGSIGRTLGRVQNKNLAKQKNSPLTCLITWHSRNYTHLYPPVPSCTSLYLRIPPLYLPVPTPMLACTCLYPPLYLPVPPCTCLYPLLCLPVLAYTHPYTCLYLPIPAPVLDCTPLVLAYTHPYTCQYLPIPTPLLASTLPVLAYTYPYTCLYSPCA